MIISISFMIYSFKLLDDSELPKCKFQNCNVSFEVKLEIGTAYI